jgi:hypothetical protein
MSPNRKVAWTTEAGFVVDAGIIPARGARTVHAFPGWVRRLAALFVLALLLLGCRREETPPEVDIEEQRRLEALGYITTVPVTEDHRASGGVTRYVRGSAHDGLNLFNSREQTIARLVDMEGREVHRWSSEETGITLERFRDLLPSFLPEYLLGWNHVEPLEGGDLLVIATHHMLLRLDWDSNVVWKLDISAHHDLAIAPDGAILVLADGVRTTELDGNRVAFQDNSVLVITPDGKVVRELSLFDAFSGTEWEGEIGRRLASITAEIPDRLDRIRQAPHAHKRDRIDAASIYRAAIRGEYGDLEGIINVLFHSNVQDIFHANSIQVMERDNPGLWRRGDLLISVLKLDIVVVIDHETGRVIWTWGEDELEEQHHATWLDDGTVLIFDNGTRREYSRVVKLDPHRRKIVWEYRGSPPSSFFSRKRGGCQELGNGNVLITETDTGRVFEVTPSGEIVWEFYSEILEHTEDGTERGALYRMTRIDPTWVTEVLAEPEQGGIKAGVTLDPDRE